MTPRDRSRLVAAIDLGTNAFRLLVAEATADGRVVPRDVHRVIPRLGEGVGLRGALAMNAIERGVEALREFRAIIDRHPVEAIVAAATSAVREAANAEEFLLRVKRDIGLDVEVISGEEEARRTWLGVRAGFAASRRVVSDAVIVDIGGGSTEIISIREGRFERALSLDLGVVKLSEQYVRHDPPRDEELRRLDAAARDALGRASGFQRGRRAVVGTAGTVTAAAVLHFGLARYDPEAIHDCLLPRAALSGLTARLGRMTAEERRRLPSLERGREDVIFAGLAILDAVLDLFHADEVRVSEYGLREGLVVDWVERSTPTT